MERLSRRSFMKIAGAATGAAALAAAPPIARAAVGEEGAQPTHPTTGIPEEPVVAYVRDAERGEVTVLPAPPRTPTATPRSSSGCSRGGPKGSELDVLAPRSTRDQQGPGRRQRRHLRVRQPRRPDTVTIITNYVPLQEPARRPELLRVRRRRPLLDLHRQRRRRACRRSTYQFRFQTTLRTRTRSSTTPGRSRRSTDPNWNKRQFYSVTRSTTRRRRRRR